ncbi:MAG TPA: ATP-binding protein, partial [Gammaproteobacteria bacterium]|nr:ATP-binding protein [Gammaproteobacteria bacterium]
MLIVLVTTLAALSVSTFALLSYEVSNYRDFSIGDASTLADVLGLVTAPALNFKDPEAARTNLEGLGNRPGIVAAAIYTPEGTLFATYTRKRDTVFPPLGAAGARVDGGTLTLFQPIRQNDEVVGTVYLEASYDLVGRLKDYFAILAGVMIVSLLVAILISFALANSVTEPVRAVTQVARQVIERRDFTMRAERTTEDEIGVLVDAVNAMLAEVGRRAEALEASNRALQQETDERRHAEAALRVADRHKNEFLATLAHELRNPLAPMVNAMRLLQSPGSDAGLVKKAHGMIDRQLAQMVRLVDDLLDVSRITSGKLTVHKEPVDLASIVQSAVDTARPLYDSRRQSLSLELPSQPVYLQADSLRLSQVFSNLLNNAAKYSDPGSRVALRAAVSGSNVRVEIEDHGIGISEPMLPKLFEMFAQGEESPSRSPAGLGVGLALAKRLVELHGGTIEARSAGEGRGSSFLVTLPVMAALTAERGREAEVAAPRPKTAHRIMLVDDNVDFATSLALLLRQSGHDVRVAHDAKQAVALAREHRPDIAFLDLGLPDVSGYALAALLRKQPESEHTVLVALSGWGQARDRLRTQAAGFTMHLVK